MIDHVEFAVDGLGQAKAFYAKALGWTFTDYGPARRAKGLTDVGRTGSAVPRR